MTQNSIFNSSVSNANQNPWYSDLYNWLIPSDEKPKKTTKIAIKGSQEGKLGPTVYPEMFNTFNAVKRTQEDGVFFNSRHLKPYLYGGTCTAMALGFIQDFIYSPTLNLRDRAIEVMKNYTKSGPTFRAQQIAFNCIEKSKETSSDDFKRAKVQSLLNFIDQKIDYASEPMLIDDIVNDQSVFKKQIEALPEGLYFLRVLNPTDNYKEERWGHSTVYIKNKLQGDYFYDPNFGLIEIADGETAAFFIDHLKTMQEKWYVSEPRFYRIKC